MEEYAKGDVVAACGEKAGVIGLGYIGLSTAMAYAREKVSVVGYDVSTAKVTAVNLGELSEVLPELEGWVGYPLAAVSSYINATTDWLEFVRQGPSTVFIAVNTERDGVPWLEPLAETLSRVLQDLPQALVIVESTVIPGTLQTLVKAEDRGRVFHAPRRDWFVSPERNLRVLPRLVGCWLPGRLEEALSDLSIVCDHLLPCTVEEAEVAKSTENALQHLLMTFASELAWAYPRIDLRRVMELTGTHWRIERTWRPGFGTGGYCIPIAGQYLLKGSDRSPHLRTLAAAQQSEEHNLNLLARMLADQMPQPLAILGVTYREGLGVLTHSVGTRLLDLYSHNRDLSVYWHDPMVKGDLFDAKNRQALLEAEMGVEQEARPTRLVKMSVRAQSVTEALALARTVLLCAPHAEYKHIPAIAVAMGLAGTLKTQYLIDESGLLAGDVGTLEALGITYAAAGQVMPWNKVG